MELLNERWVPVHGYEGRYEVSDHGRVRSVQRFRRGKSGSMVPVCARLMRVTIKKQRNNGRTLPYAEVGLRDGAPRSTPSKTFLVHRLVAQAFLGELYEGAQVDHIDGDHQNNHYTNLRILSVREHALLHPCFVDSARRTAMQAAAQARLRAMRQAGEIVGRCRVMTKEC